jgi:hypothetical protein
MAKGKSTKLNIDFEKFMYKKFGVRRMLRRKEFRVVKNDLNDDK